MKCIEIQALLENYQYGEIEDTVAAGVNAHLSNCPQCSRMLSDLEAEGELYRAYRATIERDLEVTPAMWSRVCAGIAESVAGKSKRPHPARSTWFPFLVGPSIARQIVFASLLVVVSVAGTLLVVRGYKGKETLTAERSVPSQQSATDLPGDRRVAQDLSASQGTSAKSLEAAMLAIRRAEQDYVNAIGMLNQIMEKSRPSLDPHLVYELERNLKAIDESIETTRKAYYEHPSDPYLAQYMLTAYSKKVELLQEIAS